MKPIDWLLGHFDQPGVTEIVLAVGRPAAVRTAEGLRAITTMNFERSEIETLVAGTPMSGLIGSPTSLPPAEVQVETRRFVVEVVRQGFDAALRITVPAGQRPTTPPRTITPTAAPRTMTPTAAARKMTPTAPPQPEPPPDEPPLVSVRMTTPVVPPRTLTPMPTPRPASPSSAPLAVTPLGTTSIPRITAEPAPKPGTFIDDSIDDGYAAPQPVKDLDVAYLASLEGGGEIDNADIDDIPDLPPPDWYGPQIVDEQTDITLLHALLEGAYRRNASDLHVIARQPVTIRRLGGLGPLDVNALTQPFDQVVYSALFGPLDPRLAERFLLPLLGPSARQRLAEVGYVDLGFKVPGRGRVRANISQQQDGLAGTFRLCRDQIPTLDGLGLPRELEKTVRHHQGLVVIAGPSGHGKTTTMAALVDLLNTSNSDHIITIEDPVEIEHTPKKAIVSHREVGRHTLSFVSALKASLREDPDVIVIGELRDRETVEIALTAAETGHLVLSTISTPSAVKTIDRLIDMFPPDDQIQVRASISGTLRAVIAQRLLPNATRDGMVAAIELVTGVLPLSTMIRDNKLFQLPSLMQRSRAFGMIRLDDSLADHVRARRLSEEVALAAAENKRDLAAALSSRPKTPTPTNVRGRPGTKGPS